jgi:hypothetical protein
VTHPEAPGAAPDCERGSRASDRIDGRIEASPIERNIEPQRTAAQRDARAVAMALGFLDPLAGLDPVTRGAWRDAAIEWRAGRERLEPTRAFGELT